MAVAEHAESPAGPKPGGTSQNPYSVLPNWVYPTFVATMLGLFSLYALYVVFVERRGDYQNYLSPFYSPYILAGSVIPPALWVMWAPLSFRATCYYYRKAYFRSFFSDPRSCAVPERRKGTYRGETGFPWFLNNLHRFALYFTIIQVGFLWYDVVLSFNFGGHFGIGLGTLILTLNVVLLSGYTFGCHALRHLAGGSLDCFSCTRASRARFKLWRGVTILNVRHDRWAWASLFSVAAADIYIRLLIHGVIPSDPRWIFG